MPKTATRNRQTAPTERASKVLHATREMPAAVQRALDALADFGADDERTHRAWELVEVHGATIHRQSRLLAGKSKGG